MTTSSPILVVAEQAGGRLRPGTWELVHLARRLQTLRPAPVRAALAGADPEPAARDLAACTGWEVTAIQTPEADPLPSDLAIEILWQHLATEAPSFLCLAASTRGLEWAPALAQRLEAAHVTGLAEVREEAGAVLLGRWHPADREIHFLKPLTPTVVVNPLPGAFGGEPPQSPGPGPVTVLRPSGFSPAIVPRGLRPAPTDSGPLAAAQVVVAAGNGVGERENLEWIERLAAVFPHAAVAGSRILCDRGWLPYDRQVGVSGGTVAPALYIACGISGAPQHLAGMSGSGLVVAVNTDPRAPIMRSADVGIAEDLTRFIPVFLEVVHREESKGG